MRKRRGANKGGGGARPEVVRAHKYLAEILPGYPFPKYAETRKQSPHPPSPSSVFPVLVGFSLYATLSNEVV